MMLRKLGSVTREPSTELDTFAAPAVDHVMLVCDEFTSLCPVTAQPDYSTITITYVPDFLCLESKSLKLYLWTYREKGVFCEQLAHDICDDLYIALEPKYLTVKVQQKSRGGIAIEAVARRDNAHESGSTSTHGTASRR
jgi:7-cyano-7-deazaguanine reductase